jgi:hypothetical protein
VRAESDFDLPPALEAFAPWKNKVTVVTGLNNPHAVNQHGNNWATLTVTPLVFSQEKKIERVGGISIDRFIGKKIGAGDPFPTTLVALSQFGKLDTPAAHTSADGPELPLSAYNTPVRAFAAYFGGQAPAGLPGGVSVDTKALLARDKSVLDAACGDIERVRKNLGGFERRKLDQMLESCRGLEAQLGKKAERLATGAGKPVAPTIDKTGIGKEIIRGHLDVTFQALAFGMTHVATSRSSARTRTTTAGAPSASPATHTRASCTGRSRTSRSRSTRPCSRSRSTRRANSRISSAAARRSPRATARWPTTR